MTRAHLGHRLGRGRHRRRGRRRDRPRLRRARRRRASTSPPARSSATSGPAFGRSYQTPYADRIRNEVGRSRRPGDRRRRHLLLGRRQLDPAGRPGRPLRAGPAAPVRPALDAARGGRAGLPGPGAPWPDRRTGRAAARPPTGRTDGPPPAARAGPARRAGHPATPAGAPGPADVSPAPGPARSPRRSEIRLPPAPGAVAVIVTTSPSSRNVRVDPSASVSGSPPVPGELQQRAALVALRAADRARGVQVAGAQRGPVDRQVRELLGGGPVHRRRTAAG